MCTGTWRASPARGVRFSIHPCDLSLHGSARASWLFPRHGQMLAGCSGEEPPLGVMPLGGVGGKALSHFWWGACVLDGLSSIPCRRLRVWLHERSPKWGPMCLLHPGGSSRWRSIPGDLGEPRGWSPDTPSPSEGLPPQWEGMCSRQATLVSLGVLGAGLWHSVWHWDVGPAPSASASPGGILCCAGSEQRRAFINGLSVEMSNPDMAAGG